MSAVSPINADRGYLSEHVDIEHAVERRAEYRAGYDAGVKAGINRYFQSAVMVDIAVELKVARATIDVLVGQLEWHREKLRDAYHVIGNPKHEARGAQANRVPS